MKLKSIEVKIAGHIQKSSQEICTEFLDTARWPEFTGYSILPGIKEPHFETKTPELVGTRIKVHNVSQGNTGAVYAGSDFTINEKGP